MDIVINQLYICISIPVSLNVSINVYISNKPTCGDGGKEKQEDKRNQTQKRIHHLGDTRTLYYCYIVKKVAHCCAAHNVIQYQHQYILFKVLI